MLDITDEADRQAALNNEIDVLMNNAGIMETKPVAEIPVELARRSKAGASRSQTLCE